MGGGGAWYSSKNSRSMWTVHIYVYVYIYIHVSIVLDKVAPYRSQDPSRSLRIPTCATVNISLVKGPLKLDIKVPLVV